MFQPESDWSNQNRFGVDQFSIDRRVSVQDSDVDMRRFRWVEPSSGAFSPGRHYLDYSLASQARRSVIGVDAWSDPRPTGDIVYLPPGFEYWGVPALQERRLLCVAMGDKFLENVFEDDVDAASLLPCDDVQSPRLRRLLEALAGELAAPGFASEMLVEAMLVGVAVELVRSLRPGDGDQGESTAATPRQVRMITDYIMANLSSSLSVSDIARECNMSTRHVARIFKGATGVSLGEFVARTRIARAKELLASDHVRIKEVSWRCGFQSTSAFSAAFRAATGATPREFRTGVGLQ